MKIWKNLVAAALLGACAQAYADPILSFDTHGGQAQLGSVQDYAVNIADIDDLYSYQFSINYDARYLRAVGVSEGAFLSGFGNTYSGFDVIDNATGTISFIFNSLIGPGAGAFGSGTLANIRFEAIGLGSSSLSFTDVLFLDSAFEAADIAVTAIPAQLDIVGAASDVPEPASYLLIGVGLMGAAALRRRSVNARA